MSKNDFVTLGIIGKVFGVSSHQIGKWLIEIGLRTKELRPTSAAFEGKFVLPAPLDHGGYHYTWHKAKTVAALCKAGRKTLVSLDAEKLTEMLKDDEQQVVGPFQKRQEGPSLFEIVDSNGHVATWASGDKHANDVLKSLNAAFNCGLFGGSKS